MRITSVILIGVLMLPAMVQVAHAGYLSLGSERPSRNPQLIASAQSILEDLGYGGVDAAQLSFGQVSAIHMIGTSQKSAADRRNLIRAVLLRP